ncbi:hypothetical protein AAMO2058_001159800 [Amorphochlora amoebiformis]
MEALVALQGKNPRKKRVKEVQEPVKTEQKVRFEQQPVSIDTGDICWLSDGDPAGSKGDITINREGGLSGKLKFFERIGADGAYLCRKDPEYVCPFRRPASWRIM